MYSKTSNNTKVTAEAIARYIMLQIRNISTTEKRKPISDVTDIVVLALFQRHQVSGNSGAILTQLLTAF
jgi:hypothetical protein